MRPYLALLCCLVAALPAGADPCRRINYGNSYYTPSYVAPHYDNNVIAVPVAIIPSQFYAVAPEVVTARLIAIASEDAARKAVAEYAASHPTVVPAPQPQPAPSPVPPLAGSIQAPAVPPLPTPPPIPTAKASTGTAALAVAQRMAAENCQTCHKPGSTRMQLDFAKLNRSQLAEVHFRLTTGSDKAMPPAGHKAVSEEQLNAVDALLAGATQ